MYCGPCCVWLSPRAPGPKMASPSAPSAALAATTANSGAPLRAAWATCSNSVIQFPPRIENRQARNSPIQGHANARRQVVIILSLVADADMHDHIVSIHQRREFLRAERGVQHVAVEGIRAAGGC